MREAIVSLPRDMKAVLRIVEHPHLEDAHRTLAAGALLHVLSGQNAIPGMRGVLAHVGDVIVLRLALEQIAALAPDVMSEQRERAPEVFEPMEEQMIVVRDYLGDLLGVLEKATAGLPELTHQGYSAADCAVDEDASTWLYDAVHEAIIGDLDIDEADVERALRSVHQIRRPLELRLESR